MKLYSKKQVIIYSVISCVLGILLASASLIPNVKDKLDNKREQENIVELILNEENQSKEQTSQISINQDYSAFSQNEIQNINVYDSVNEAVVNITTQVMGYNWFYEPVITGGGSGSGSIIDKRGYIVTNYHVIENASTIYISLADGSSYEGKVVGRDKNTDIAVLKFDVPKGMELKTINFGNSDNLKVGQNVIAIGNPFGLERTMTTGIISGLGRPIQESGTDVIIRNMIQTDAAINPGNSGGPLLNSKGEMIGINTIIYSSSGSSSGVGFAIPVSTARRVVADLITYGKVNRGEIKISIIQNTKRIANYAGYKISHGLIITKVQNGSQADISGLKSGKHAVQFGTFNPQTIYLGGDIITAINDISITKYADYLSALEDKKPGDTVVLTIYRNNKYEKISVKLEQSETSHKI